MIDRICDRGRHADDTDLAQSLDAQWIDDGISLVDKDHLDVVDVRIHWNMIFGNIRVHDTAEMVINQRLFVQRHADPPNHAADDLAACNFGI